MRWGVICSSAVFAQRHVRCNARQPEVVEHVHLAEKSRVAREVREELVLVVETPAAGVQRGLVERRERDAVDSPLQREPDHIGERLAGDASRFGRHLAARDRAGIDVRKIDDGDIGARPIDLFGGLIGAQVDS